VAAILTLLTDFGDADYYVGALKGTLLRLAPRALLVDLSHQLPAGDVEAAADLLAGAAPTFPPGTCHLAVVDPGVGSARRMLVVESGGHHFVAPDNGLLTLFFAPATGVWAVTRTDLFVAGPGATFHGRDRFAPVAAALLRGDHPAALGEPIADPVRLPTAPPVREPGPRGVSLRGRVVRIDRYGNLVTDLPADWLRGTARFVRAEVAGRRCERWVTHYAELPAGEPGAMIGSRGTLELALRDQSLAQRWGSRRGDPVAVALAPERG
jgi:S-adenosyl-L-methionine hydrolase (adenosine-forming)